jgi:hypothetical protein
MSYPFNVIVEHHEGDGKPRNGVYLPHYSYIIGLDEWHLRSDLVDPAAPKPGGDTSTGDFNRTVIGVCATGQRQTGIPDSPAYPVTNTDIQIRVEIGNDARKRGWLVDYPNVVPHKDMPGNSTACPGDLTLQRWAEIKNAYQAHPVPVPQQGGVLLTTVASPQKGNPSGRVPTARPIPELGAILLENGASLKGDSPSGHNRVWLSNDAAVKANGNKLIDITPAFNGVIALFDLGNGQTGTYQLEWS